MYTTLERTFKPIIPQLYHNHLPLYLDLNRRSNKLSGSGVVDVRTLSQSMFGDDGGWVGLKGRRTQMVKITRLFLVHLKMFFLIFLKHF